MLWCQTGIVSLVTSYRCPAPGWTAPGWTPPGWTAPGRTALGFNPSGDKRYLSSPNHPDWLWDPPCFLFDGYRSSFLGVKQPGFDVNLSPPSGAEFENDWSYISTPLWCGEGQHCLLLPFTSPVTILHICSVKRMAFCDLFVSAVLSNRKRSVMIVHDSFSFHMCRNLVCTLVTNIITTKRNYTCSNKTGNVHTT